MRTERELKTVLGFEILKEIMHFRQHYLGFLHDGVDGERTKALTDTFTFFFALSFRMTYNALKNVI